MSAFAETLRNLGSTRVVAAAGVGVGLIAFFIFLVSRLTGPELQLLYSELDTNDSSRIVSKLEAMQVPYELQGNGSQILVPADEVARLRMSMAEEGLPAGGSVGYELFDDSDTLGTTSFVQNVNLLRALEGELARTIRAISNVESARVHLVMPRRQLFSREKEEPSASIVLKLRGTSRFAPSQVLAIQHLVAAAVPGLKPDRVSVIDDKGALLARTAEEEDAGYLALDADEMRRAYENQIAGTVEELLERSVGIGKVRAEVTADMNFDRVTTNTESYDPEGQVVRSTQLVEEEANTTEIDGEGTVTVESNLPEGQGAAEAGGPQSASQSLRTEETVNYEISKTVKQHVREGGIVNRLSVAVLVDGTYATAEDGTKEYVPRTDEEMQQYEKLVRSAVGFDEERGDVVELVNMPFAKPDVELPEEAPPPLFGLSKNDYFRIAELLVLGVVAMLVILLVIRPLTARLYETIAANAERNREMLTDQRSGGSTAALAAPESAVSGDGGGQASSDNSELETMIDLDQVEGRVKASSLKKVGEIVEKHPEETVSIIRNWMFQER